jgi:hypothetical protein
VLRCGSRHPKTAPPRLAPCTGGLLKGTSFFLVARVARAAAVTATAVKDTGRGRQHHLTAGHLAHREMVLYNLLCLW